MTSSTVRMRLAGMTVRHALAALVTASPLGLVGEGWVTRHILPAPPLLVGVVVLALVPWLGRAWVRRATAAKCDDIAVHAGGEALPYRTIKSVRLDKTARRHVLVLERSAEIVLRLVWWDAVAGRMEPREPLLERLAASGLTISEE